MKSIKNYLTVLILTVFTTTVGLSQNTTYGKENVDGLEIFYRESGKTNKPTLVLLHGYPTSSFMYRNLIEELSNDYHLIAPDYPGFGRSSQPAMVDFEYTFENIAGIMNTFLEQKNINKYSLYVMDYGAPIGYRIFSKHPERIQSLIIQNGNAYEEGLGAPLEALKANWANNNEETRKPLESFHSLEGLKWQYTVGVKDPSKISPDNWYLDYQHIQREGNNDIQLAMFYDYRTNLPLYSKWQKNFRKHQPATLVVWGKNDPLFPAIGAKAYKKDLKNIEIHLLDSGHFALEDKGTEIANYIRNFLKINNIK